jgi:hypothetical protein
MIGRALAWWRDLADDPRRLRLFAGWFALGGALAMLAAVHLIGLIRWGHF